MAYSFHHVALRPLDRDKSIRMYVEGLGARVIRLWDHRTGAKSAMIELEDGTILEMFQRVEANGPAPDIKNEDQRWFHIAFESDNPDACYYRALKAGFTSYLAPYDIDVPSDPKLPLRCAFVQGPDGEIIEFLQKRCVRRGPIEEVKAFRSGFRNGENS